MKRTTKILAVAVIALSVVGARQARADEEVYVGANFQSTDDFRQPLADYGYWVWMQPYGWVWYPSYVDNGWRPYTSGHWVWSDYGWYWVSDEPWGWATYHYGRWMMDPYYGWVWVPGTEWGPSWVAWREGPEYIGWAPLPPRCGWGGGGRFMFEESWIQPDWYVFVGYNHFCGPIHRRTVIVNKTIVYKTVNITKINHADTVIINQGPGLDSVRKVNADKVRVVNFAQQAKEHGGKPVRVVPPQFQAWKEGRQYDAPHRGKPEVSTRVGAPVMPKSVEKAVEKQNREAEKALEKSNRDAEKASEKQNRQIEKQTRQQENSDRVREQIQQNQNRKQKREQQPVTPRVVPRQNWQPPVQQRSVERYVAPTNDRQVDRQQRMEQYQRTIQERSRVNQDRFERRQSQRDNSSSRDSGSGRDDRGNNQDRSRSGSSGR